MARRRKRLNTPFNLEKKTIKTILAAAILTFSLLLLLSFFSKAGLLLSLKDSFYRVFGVGVIFLPFFGVIFSLLLFALKSRFTKINVVLGAVGALLSFSGLLAVLSEKLAGIVGVSLWSVFKSLVTPIGAFLVLLFAFLVSLTVATNASFDQALAIFAKIYSIAATFFKKLSQLLFARSRPRIQTRPEGTLQKPGHLQTIEPSELPTGVIANPPSDGKIWQYPPLSLLSDAKGAAANRGNPKHNAQIIEKTLEAFGIVAKVIEVNPGPTVTQYALQIPVGTKLSKILALQNDLALALATTTGNVRIEAPIPGKSLVGVEIPNISPEIVNLKSVLSSEILHSNKSKTAVGLGLDVSGNIAVADINKMPHVLIAGTTGSGKSVLLNAIIATILFRASPQEVKFIIADPKRVELTDYNDVPHLLTPVIIEPDKILSSLRWAEKEMERRYRLFHEAQVNNIASYNEFSGFQVLPYIVIILDELYILMEYAPREVEDSIHRLAAMARATGIHLVIATQRPSVDVITGTIKANISCRIAFNVSSMVDSRVILDQPGAEKLLGRGDMLYLPPDAQKPVRIQGVFASPADIRNLITFLKRSGFASEYTEEVTQMPLGRVAKGVEGETDELFEEAVRTICQYDRASASLLQRRLHVGYARAARLIDQMEMAGIVGPGEGSKPRDVLYKNADEYFAQVQSQPSS
ncbi:DNA translocase FtsK [Candidatus Curtissbacteria bacterium]|nr:DNA translocase FtsK [Candidatus Curtissbacteria bacterium]